MNGISELNYYSKFARLLYSFTYILDLIFFLNQERYTLNQIKIAVVVFTSLASDRFLQKVSKLDSIFKSNHLQVQQTLLQISTSLMKHCDFTNKTKRNPIFYIEFDNAADIIGLLILTSFNKWV